MKNDTSYCFKGASLISTLNCLEHHLTGYTKPMKYPLIGILAGSYLLAIPLVSFAATDGAGFETQSIFLSRASVTEGETVLVYASVSNVSTGAFQGSLVFKDASKSIGNLPVSLSPGEARLVSLSWEPKAGAHTIVAELDDASGKSVATESQTFTVTAKPVVVAQSAANLAAAVESSAGLEQAISQISPQTGNVIGPILSSLDGLRSTAADILDSQIEQTQPKLPGGMLQGMPGGANKPQDAPGWVLVVFWTIYFYLLTIVRVIIGSVVIFYPVLAILFIYLLYRLYRRTANPLY